MPPIGPRPFQNGFHKDKARRPCRAPAALQGLSEIVIPSRRIQARHIGQLCSIRGKNGGWSIRRRALPQDWANRQLIEISSGFASCSRLCAFLFFSLGRLLIAAVSSSRNDFAKHEVRCLHVLRRERQLFPGCKKSGCPGFPIPYSSLKCSPIWNKQVPFASYLDADAHTNRRWSCLVVSPSTTQARRRPDINHTQIRLIHETIQSSNCWRRGCRPSHRVLGRACLCREHVGPGGRLPPCHGRR